MLGVFAFDLAWPLLLDDLGEVLERYRASLGIDDPDRTDLIGIVPPGLGQPNAQWVPLSSSKTVPTVVPPSEATASSTSEALMP